WFTRAGEGCQRKRPPTLRILAILSISPHRGRPGGVLLTGVHGQKTMPHRVVGAAGGAHHTPGPAEARRSARGANPVQCSRVPRAVSNTPPAWKARSDSGSPGIGRRRSGAARPPAPPRPAEPAPRAAAGPDPRARVGRGARPGPRHWEPA